MKLSDSFVFFLKDSLYFVVAFFLTILDDLIKISISPAQNNKSL